MTEDAGLLLLPRRGEYRFRHVVENRYSEYNRPEFIRAVCVRCGSTFAFLTDPASAQLIINVVDERLVPHRPYFAAGSATGTNQ
jgi:hypothetical protein